MASQRDDPDSVLRLTRDLLAARREREDLRSGSYASLATPDGVWAWQRGDRHAVAINLGDADATVELAGTILIGTNRDRDGQQFSSLTLGASEAALLEL